MTASTAALELGIPFTDCMVLQRNQPVKIWGKGANGHTVTVQFRTQSRSARVADNRWEVTLDPLAAGGPDSLCVQCGKETRQLVDVLVGEVWIAGGQSNMGVPMRSHEDAEHFLAQAHDAELRILQLPVTEFGTYDRSRIRWRESTPESAGWFSAVAFFFARQLRERLRVPVGIIGCYRGATCNEYWTPRDLLQADPASKALVERYERQAAAFASPREYDRAYQVYVEKRAAWQAAGGWSTGVCPFPPMGPKSYQRPGGLYETMVTPLQPFALRGAIWYQGEGNASRPEQYESMFPALVRGWRRDWGQGEFPFLFVQLPPYDGVPRYVWARFREAQLACWRSIPNSGMIVSAGCGDRDDIHPAMKKPIGDRLAIAAHARVYGRDIVPFGPVFRAMTIEGTRAVLSFDYTGSGLEARPGPLGSFEICGPDRAFRPAAACIDGDHVMVSCKGIDDPVAVRYAFRSYPVMDLYNREGLPATPFRTDSFPLTHPKPE